MIEIEVVSDAQDWDDVVDEQPWADVKKKHEEDTMWEWYDLGILEAMGT